MLNEKQLALVQAPPGKILCLAGAGSGKTFSLMEKIKFAVSNQGIAPFEILAVTFTKKAAREMQNRILSTLGPSGKEVKICTLNSFCATEVINQDPSYFGYTKRPLIVLDGYYAILKGMFKDESKEMLKSLAKAVDYHLTRCLPLPHEYVTRVVDKKNGTVTERIWDLLLLFEDMRRYQKVRNVITFTDQIFFGYERLRDDVDFRHWMGSKYRLIIVDEAQDNNFMQNKIVLFMSEVHGNITAVGDDAQSIFRFRGADAQFFLDLHYKEGFALYKLTDNYRSYQPILDLGNAVLKPNFEAKVQVEKMLQAVRQNKDAPRPHFSQFFDMRQEAQYISLEVKKYLLAGGSPADVAILCRSVLGGQGRIVQGVLRNMNIPYQVVGGVDVTKSIHVRRMFSAFALACGYTMLDDWVELLKVFPLIGDVRANKIANLIAEGKWDKVIKHDGVAGLKQLLDLLKVSLNNPYNCYMHFSNWYLAELEEHYEMDESEFRYARGNLDVIGSALEGATLEAALESIKLDPEVLDTEDDGKVNAKVTISTCHRAKGLEWPLVIITDCHDLMFPHKMAITETDVQEECRIFHVAVTRARDRLLLTTTLADQKAKISRFIDHKFVTGLRS